jgi:hypothetical protein
LTLQMCQIYSYGVGVRRFWPDSEDTEDPGTLEDTYLQAHCVAPSIDFCSGQLQGAQLMH